MTILIAKKDIADMRVYKEDGRWDHDALAELCKIAPRIQALFDTLKAAGLNYREASLLLKTGIMDEELMRSVEGN
jgi:hypothetical protein